MEKIAIIVPTRDRVDNLSRLRKSWEEFTDGKSILVPVVDTDQVEKYAAVIEGTNWVVSNPNKPTCLRNKLNQAAVLLAKNYEVIASLGDDFVFQTPGWEGKIIDWQEQNKGICYCNDLLQGKNLPTGVFMHSDLIKAMGYMVPFTLDHYYVDNFWLDLALRLENVKYFPEIIIEHRHWSNKKSPKDELYQSTENKYMELDKKAWDEFREEMLSYSIKLIDNFKSKTHDSTRAT